MVGLNIENIIINFVNKSATKIELDFLNDWIKNPSNQTIFKEYIRINYEITLVFLEPDLTEINKNFFKQIKRDKNLFFNRVKFISKYAALVFLLISLGYFLRQEFLKSSVEPTLIPKEDIITLTLSDGSIQPIDEGNSIKINDSLSKTYILQKNKQLTYNSNDEIDKLTFNTLTVPYGKRFSILLSDSTRVVMNSGSSLRYPVTFILGQPRKVFLEGEAFFDVSKDNEHQFYVETQNVDVKVYGTKFNISSYKNNVYAKVTLIEGSVSMSLSDNTIENTLKSGSLGTFDKNLMFSSKIVNTSIYTSWINGKLVFRDTSFNEILKKLERSYNVTIINNNKNIRKERFNATINIDKESINDVLYYFSKLHNIKYNIIENKLIIQ